MLGPRTRPRKVKVHEVIYAMGGRSSEGRLTSVERHDIGKGNPVWESIAPMSTPRSAPGVAVLGSLIYVVGGNDGQNVLNSSERFDSTTCEWSSDIAPMSVPRATFGAAALDDFVYAVGGYNGSECLDTVERWHWLLLRNNCTLWVGLVGWTSSTKPLRFLISRRVNGDITAA
ncbi:kelch repeat protein [Teladorsagia circumcincta]|uniref:Kelch repeat protein n=1 Tax=Teladorsagia circumcincta TaxID=45464 RepID=A0A2G9TX76_TELCI|nr:kelch repeat protein [Teladorsagia circumcincta]